MQSLFKIINYFTDHVADNLGLLKLKLTVGNVNALVIPSLQWIYQKMEGMEGPDSNSGFMGPILITSDYVLDPQDDWDMSLLAPYQLPDGNGYTAFDYTTDSWSQWAILPIGASGGDIGPFRYAVFLMNNNKVAFIADFLDEVVIEDGTYFPYFIHYDEYAPIDILWGEEV